MSSNDISRDVSLREFTMALDNIIECSVEETGGSRKKKERDVVPNLHKTITNMKCERMTDIMSKCDALIHDWESSGRVSAAMQQLVTLLNRPHIRGLLSAADDVANGRFLNELPPVPYEVDDDDGIAVKIVRLVKRGEPMGATIKRDWKGRVLIARVISGGVADRSACILEGDRVLEVNGVSVNGLDTAEIAKLMSETDNGNVTIKLIAADPTPSTHSNIHLRAMFDYDGASDKLHPCPETALSFSKGDILELLVCGDEHWWQARRLGRGGMADGEARNGNGGVGVGLVPSESLQSRRRQAVRDGRASVRSKGSADSDDTCSYEPVCLLPPGTRTRPVCLIGAPGVGRNELKKRLMHTFPDKYSVTVPHTSRPPRSGEVPGINYHFASRSTMESMIHNGEMIEFGEYKGNWYGTAKAAVLQAATRGVPLLTPNPLSLRALRSPVFAPLIVFVRAPDKETFLESRESLRSTASSLPRAFTSQEVDNVIETSLHIERAYGHLFDAEVVNGNIEKCLSQLIRIIKSFETQPSWVPLSWATKIDQAFT